MWETRGGAEGGGDGLDLTGVPTERLEAELCSVAAHLAALTCRFLELVAEFDRREAFVGWESCSTAHWLNWKCGVSLHTAREQVRVARALSAMPAVRAAFATGRLSYSKVRAMSRVCHPSIEEGLVGLAEHATAAQLEQACGALRRGATLAEEEERLRRGEAAGEERSHLSWSRDESGHLVGTFRLAPEDGELFVAAVEGVVDGLRIDEPADDREPVDRLRARALVGLAHGRLADPDRGRGPRPEIVVHVDLAALDAGRHTWDGDVPAGTPLTAGTPEESNPAEAMAERRWPVRTVRGTSLSLAVLARLAGDAGLCWVADLPDGSELNLGRHRRTVSDAQFRALLARDGHCRFPGCSSRHRLHAHHIIWWVHGGRTDMDNLVLLCGKHHHAVHDRGWSCTGTATAPVFSRPDGQDVLNAPPCYRGDVAEVLTAAERDGLDVAVEHPGGRWGGERIDWDCFFAAFAVPLAEATSTAADGALGPPAGG